MFQDGGWVDGRFNEYNATMIRSVGYFLAFGFGFFFFRQTLSFLEKAQSLGL